MKTSKKIPGLDLLKDADKVPSIVHIFYPQARVILFGSRARGDFNATSDLDIAIDNGQALDFTTKNKIRAMIELLNMPCTVDVIDVHQTSAEMRESITREGIEW